jgi:hypothetical protein
MSGGSILSTKSILQSLCSPRCLASMSHSDPSGSFICWKLINSSLKAKREQIRDQISCIKVDPYSDSAVPETFCSISFARPSRRLDSNFIISDQLWHAPLNHLPCAPSLFTLVPRPSLHHRPSPLLPSRGILNWLDRLGAA